MSMTETEMRIAVAECCGWKDILDTDFKVCVSIHGRPPQSKSVDDHRCEIPNYTRDLNAMHEAWLTLNEAEKIVFAETLFAVTKGEVLDWGYYPDEASICWDDISNAENATAHQRAEAFLRTKGLI